MSVLNTNAKAAYDADGDFIGYALPSDDPVSIGFRFETKFRGDENVDELVYEVRWANGIYADMFTIPNHWHHIKLSTAGDVARRNLAGVDAALERMRTEVLTPAAVRDAVNLGEAVKAEAA